MTQTKINTRTKSPRIIMAICFLVLVALGVCFYWYIFVRGIVSSDDARFNGDLVDLSPEVGGNLLDVSVKEGEFVKKGQKLFQIDPVFFQLALTQSMAALEIDKGKLEAAKARSERSFQGARIEEIKAAEAVYARLVEEEHLAGLENKRIESLREEGATSQDELDRSRSKLVSARHAQENALQNLTLLQKGTRKEDISAALADLQTAKGQMEESLAAVDQARLTLERASVCAPFDGWIVRRWLDPGANVTVGRPVVTLFDPNTLRVDANIEEKYLSLITVGNEVDVRVDAFPELKLKGKVTDILRATNSQFSLVPSDGTSGTFIKVSQRVPLRISAQTPDNIPLGPGLSVEVKIHVNISSDES